jgi:hypothetical protein
MAMIIILGSHKKLPGKPSPKSILQYSIQEIRYCSNGGRFGEGNLSFLLQDKKANRLSVKLPAHRAGLHG